MDRGVMGDEHLEDRRESRHFIKGEVAHGEVLVLDAALRGEQDALGLEMVDPHQPERGAQDHRGHAVLVDDEGFRLVRAETRRG